MYNYFPELLESVECKENVIRNYSCKSLIKYVKIKHQQFITSSLRMRGFRVIRYSLLVISQISYMLDWLYGCGQIYIIFEVRNLQAFDRSQPKSVSYFEDNIVLDVIDIYRFCLTESVDCCIEYRHIIQPIKEHRTTPKGRIL